MAKKEATTEQKSAVLFIRSVHSGAQAADFKYDVQKMRSTGVRLSLGLLYEVQCMLGLPPNTDVPEVYRHVRAAFRAVN